VVLLSLLLLDGLPGCQPLERLPVVLVAWVCLSLHPSCLLHPVAYSWGPGLLLLLLLLAVSWLSW
jgi:hypothetical protein